MLSIEIHNPAPIGTKFGTVIVFDVEKVNVDIRSFDFHAFVRYKREKRSPIGLALELVTLAQLVKRSSKMSNI